MVKARKAPSAIAWHGIVGQLPCQLCKKLGLEQRYPTEVHHDTASAGMAERAGDFLVVSLCSGDCHRGPHGVHGDKRRLYAAKVTEADLINETIAMGFAHMAEVMGHQVGGAPDLESEAVAVLRQLIDHAPAIPPGILQRARQVVGDG